MLADSQAFGQLFGHLIGREREIDPLEILRPRLGMHVALRGRDPRVSKELLHEAASPQAFQRFRRGIGEREEARLPALVGPSTPADTARWTTMRRVSK